MTFAFPCSSVSLGVWISIKTPVKIGHLEFQLIILTGDNLNLTGNINVPVITLLMSLLETPPWHWVLGIKLASKTNKQNY